MPVISVDIESNRPVIAANLEELRYLVFQGMTGDTGQSAYELAVSLGFEGTEAEWIASLQGADGADGKDGKDGRDGKNYGIVVDGSVDHVLELKSVEAGAAQDAAVRDELGYEVVDLSGLTLNRGRIEAASGKVLNSSAYRYALLAPQSDWKRLLIYQPFHERENQETSYQATMIAFLTSETLTVDEYAPFCASAPGVVTLDAYESACLDIPGDCAFVYILIKNNGASSSTNRDVTPTVYALTDGGELNAICGLLPETGLPAYYNKYLGDRIEAILNIQNSISANHDAFLFITDYHYTSNAGHSLDMIRYISRSTGITKLFYSGDSGGGTPSNLKNALLRLRRSAEVWDDLQRQADEFYGALGNHEWINTDSEHTFLNQSAMLGSYLNRFKQRCLAMDAYGDYTVDNSIDKILYVFLQQTSGCKLDGAQLKWLCDQLGLLPSGYHVLVVMHHGYIPNEVTSEEYGTTISGASYGQESGSHAVAKQVNQILHAYETGGNITVDGTYYSFTGGTAIGVFCGHYHHGTLFPKNALKFEPGVYTTPGTSSTNPSTHVTTGDDVENYVCATCEVSQGDVITINATGGNGTHRRYDILDSEGYTIKADYVLTDERYVPGVITVNITQENAASIVINNQLAQQSDGYYAYKGYNDEQIVVFRGGTDTLSAATVAYEGSGMPWYTDQDGNRVVRAAGTTNEQCFYAVQIDLDAKKLYITAIGGDHDYPAVPFGGGT